MTTASDVDRLFLPRSKYAVKVLSLALKTVICLFYFLQAFRLLFVFYR